MVQQEFEALEERIRTILPEAYQDCYEDVQPVSMGSAGLKFGRDGRVAWDEIWGSFCDLAMAVGPPHKGRLLEPGSREENGTHAEQYLAVVTEICRGIFMVAELAAGRSTVPGWVRVNCPNQGMAEWLTRAIVMEDVSVRYEGAALSTTFLRDRITAGKRDQERHYRDREDLSLLGGTYVVGAAAPD